jgi:capsular exopolysaccharide synthesis family protein
MEIKDLLSLMWRNVRFLILGIALGAAIGILVTELEPPVYEATTKALVSRARQQSGADMLPLSDEQLLAINLQLAKAQSVLDIVSARLESRVDADSIQVSAVPNTLILQIKVQDANPIRAAAIANLLIETLIQQNESLLSGRYVVFEDSINSQIDHVQKQIDSLQAEAGEITDANIQEQLAQVNQQIDQIKVEISTLEEEIARFPASPTALDSASLGAKQTQLDQFHTLMNLYQQIQANLTFTGKPGQGGSGLDNPRLESIQSALGLYQQIYLNLISSRELVRLARMQSKQNVVQLVSAIAPNRPIRPMPVLYILVAALVGLSISAAAILIVDQFDNSLEAPSQTETLLGIPLMGIVLDTNPSRDELVTISAPYSMEAEAFRVLASCMDIKGAGKSIRTLLVANAAPLENKTSIAANLAVVNAQQGKKVILVDGDLKHPHLHNFFRIENRKGLTDLIHGRSDIKSVSHAVGNIEGLSLVPGGIIENQSTGWLDAERLSQLLLGLRDHADLVIVDGSPPDSANVQVFASQMNAVLLIIRLGKTRIDSAQDTLKRFQLIGGKVIGAVINRSPRKPIMDMRLLSRIKIKWPGGKNSHTANKEIDQTSISPL